MGAEARIRDPVVCLEEHGEDGVRLSLLNQLYEIGDFIRRVRLRGRFGQFSRAPLQLLRWQLQGAAAECEWLARAPDRWDMDLPRHTRDRNASMQALADALSVREFLFSALPGVDSAEFRVYRQPAEGKRELIIAGTVDRNEAVPVGIRSLAMRAKLCGLQFRLDDDRLEALQPEEHELELWQEITPSLG